MTILPTIVVLATAAKRGALRDFEHMLQFHCQKALFLTRYSSGPEQEADFDPFEFVLGGGR